MSITPAKLSPTPTTAVPPALQPAMPADRELSRFDVPLSYYWFLLQKYRNRILAFVVVVTAAVMVLGASRPKIYEGTAIVRVDPSGVHVVGASENQSDAGDARLLVATEAAVITSPAVEQQAIDSLGLANDPEFRPALPATASPVARSTLLLRNVNAHIGVSQPLDTYLLAIHFRSKNPQMAARAANGLAHAFLEHEYSTRARALTDSTAYMADQMDGMRAQMEKDQAALVNYESTHDVINADDRSNIYQARLQQINQELTKAQALRMSAQADAQAASSGSLTALLATPGGKELIPVQAQYLSDQRELATLATVYGSNHPRYRQQFAVVQHDRQVMQARAQQLAAQIRSRYLVAYRDESLLANSLAQQKKAVDAFNMRAVRYQALKAASTSSTQLYYDLEKQIQDATVAAGQRSEDLRITSPASPSSIPVSPRLKLWFALALVLSFCFAAGTALLMGVLDKSITATEQIEQWFHVPVIGVLPATQTGKSREMLSPRWSSLQAAPPAGAVAQDGRLTSFQESMFGLHSALAFALGEDAATLAITSSVPAEGKSTVSGNLAAAFATLGRRTLLIDADLRKPSLHTKFGTSRQPGLSNILRGQSSAEDAIRQIGPNLSLIPAGSSCHSPVELLHSCLEEMLLLLRPQFDFVLLDCPPVLGFADAEMVASVAGNVLMVIHAGATDRGQVHTALQRLSRSGANLTGVILNQVSAKTGHYYGYYNADGYQRYYDEESDQARD